MREGTKTALAYAGAGTVTVGLVLLLIRRLRYGPGRSLWGPGGPGPATDTESAYEPDNPATGPQEPRPGGEGRPLIEVTGPTIVDAQGRPLAPAAAQKRSGGPVRIRLELTMSPLEKTILPVDQAAAEVKDYLQTRGFPEPRVTVFANDYGYVVIMTWDELAVVPSENAVRALFAQDPRLQGRMRSVAVMARRAPPRRG